MSLIDMKDAIALRGHVIYVIKKSKDTTIYEIPFLCQYNSSCYEYVLQGHTSFSIKKYPRYFL